MRSNAPSKAVMRLPDKQRAVFTMRYFEELKYEEMSALPAPALVHSRAATTSL
jgi:DNA-directed RNA polymerase specialized sigma24 family protein